MESMVDGFAQLAELVPSPPRRPCLVAITGAVAAGKSTAAARLSREIPSRTTAVVATDGFLMTNSQLHRRDAWHRKGHPDTYDVESLAGVVGRLRSRRPATAPVYSHLVYDRVAGAFSAIPAADVVILEGLHLLHDHFAAIRDMLDLSVFLDASARDLESWYVARLRGLVERAHDAPHAFGPYRDLAPEDVESFARSTWETVNVPTNATHIDPTRALADVVVEQDAHHDVVAIRARR